MLAGNNELLLPLAHFAARFNEELLELMALEAFEESEVELVCA